MKRMLLNRAIIHHITETIPAAVIELKVRVVIILHHHVLKGLHQVTLQEVNRVTDLHHHKRQDLKVQDARVLAPVNRAAEVEVDKFKLSTVSLVQQH